METPRPLLTDVPPIVTLKTGESFGGGRFGLIAAADFAPPGSLILLTEFLREKGYRPLPGYSGTEKSPVLRIGGFSSDAEITEALHKGFTEWQAKKGVPVERQLTMPPGMGAEPLPMKTVYRAAEDIGGFINQHRNLLPALSFVAGDLALLGSSWRRGQLKDKWRMGAAGAYGLAAVNLLTFGGKADVPRNTRAILAAVEPELNEPHHHTGMRKGLEQAHLFLQRHPWEISGLLNMAGLAPHLVSAMNNKSSAGFLEAAGVAASFTAMMMQSFLPEQGGEPILDVGRVLGTKRADYPPLTQDMLDHPVVKSQTALARYLSNPIHAAGPLSALSNAGWAVSSMLKPKQDWGLLASAGFYLNGNLLQMRASKDYTPSFDDYTSGAAAKILADKRPADVLIPRIAEAMSLKPEVHASRERLESAIRYRVEARQGEPDLQNTGGLLASEQEFIARSPFLPAHLAKGMTIAATPAR